MSPSKLFEPLGLAFEDNVLQFDSLDNLRYKEKLVQRRLEKLQEIEPPQEMAPEYGLWKTTKLEMLRKLEVIQGIIEEKEQKDK